MRIAVVQLNPVFDDLARACDVISDRLRWAEAQAIDLLLFPEAFVLGHSYDTVTIRQRAEALLSGGVATLCDRLRGSVPTLVVGAFECDGDAVFNRALVIERGVVCGRYAKAFPNEPGVTAGVAFPVFERSGVRFGINICNDANHAEPAARIAAQGATLLLYPLNNMLRPETAQRWREKSLDNLVVRARQTGCWVASADVVGTAGALVSHGCSAIVSPAGEIVARVPEDEAGVALFDLAAV